MDIELVEQLQKKAERIVDHYASKKGGKWSEHNRLNKLLPTIMGPGHIRFFPSNMDPSECYIDFKDLHCINIDRISWNKPGKLYSNSADINITHTENKGLEKVTFQHCYTSKISRFVTKYPGEELAGILSNVLQYRSDVYDEHVSYAANNHFRSIVDNDFSETENTVEVTIPPKRTIVVIDKKLQRYYDYKMIYWCDLDFNIEVHGKGGFTSKWSSMVDMKHKLRREDYKLPETKIQILATPVLYKAKAKGEFSQITTGNISVRDRKALMKGLS